MSRRAGQHDTPIGFRIATVTEDAVGVEREVFVDGTNAWARVSFGTGSERREAAAAGAVQSATFRVIASNATRAITRRDLIRYEGEDWGIASIAQVGPQGAEIEFVATVRKG